MRRRAMKAEGVQSPPRVPSRPAPHRDAYFRVLYSTRIVYRLRVVRARTLAPRTAALPSPSLSCHEPIYCIGCSTLDVRRSFRTWRNAHCFGEKRSLCRIVGESESIAAHQTNVRVQYSTEHSIWCAKAAAADRTNGVAAASNYVHREAEAEEAKRFI